MRRKGQKFTIGIIIGIICLTLIGSTFVAVFRPGGSDSDSYNEEVVLKEYNQRKEKVEILKSKVEENPENIELQLELADAYFNKSQISGQFDQKEFKEDLTMAVKWYKAVLDKKEDAGNEVRFKLATAAFLAGDDELADNTYKEILEKEPDNVQVRYAYGMFLFYNQKKYEDAIAEWEAALEKTEDEEMKGKLQEMISIARGAMASGSGKKGEGN